MSDTELKVSDILALDHTRLAAERTLHGLGSSSSFHDQLWVYHLHVSARSSGAKHVARYAAEYTARRGTCARRHRNLCGHRRLCSTLEIHKKVETRSTLQALGPDAHRGLLYWDSWLPDVREHHSKGRPLRVKTVISNQ